MPQTSDTERNNLHSTSRKTSRYKRGSLSQVRTRLLLVHHPTTSLWVVDPHGFFGLQISTMMSEDKSITHLHRNGSLFNVVMLAERRASKECGRATSMAGTFRSRFGVGRNKIQILRANMPSLVGLLLIALFPVFTSLSTYDRLSSDCIAWMP